MEGKCLGCWDRGFRSVANTANTLNEIVCREKTQRGTFFANVPKGHIFALLGKTSDMYS